MSLYIHEVFEKKQAFVSYSLQELMNMQKRNDIELREKNQTQIRAIRKYIINNSINGHIFLPPIVAMLPEGEVLANGKPSRLSIIDGSQRMLALLQLENIASNLINSQDDYDLRKGFELHYLLKEIQIAVQVFEGLTVDEANQMFIDLNTKGKKVSLSKRIAYDSRNDINVVTNELLASHKSLKIAGVDVEKVALKRPTNKNFLSLSQLRKLVSLFVIGKIVPNTIEVQSIHSNTNVKLLHRWLDELFLLYPPQKIGDYEESMLASFPVLLSVAQYARKGLKGTLEEQEKQITEKMQKLVLIDWRRSHEQWQQFNGERKGLERYYYLNNDKKTIQSIVQWLELKGGEAVVKESK